MKTLVVSILCLASVVLADDFKTIDGKEYKNATVSRIEPDGIVLITKSGISKVYFTELPKDVQERFHYDPQKAAEFTSQTTEKIDQVLKQRTEQAQQRARETAKYWDENPTPRPAPAEHGSALDARSTGQQQSIYGTVQGHYDEGILVRVHETNTFGVERIPNGARVLIGNFPDLYDNDKVQVSGRLVGTRDHVTSDGGSYTLHETVRVIEVSHIIKLTVFPPNVSEY